MLQFGATTEKFIRDWQNATVIIAVRDNRQHETDPLLGVVILPLQEIFKRRDSSIFQETMPIMGGIGYGRMKVSLMFRSVKLSLPMRLKGWDVGTVEVFSGVKVNLREGQEGASTLEGCKMRFRIGSGEGAITGKSKGKMYPYHEGQKLNYHFAYDHHGQQVEWSSKEGKPVRLPVKARYSSSVIVEFVKKALGADQTLAFGTMWLKDVPDDEELLVTIPIFSYRMRKNSIGKKEKAGVKYASMNAAAPTAARVTGKMGEDETTVNNHGDAGVLEEGERDGDRVNSESIGQVELKLNFHSGLSGYHHAISAKDRGMADVMQILDCVEGTHGMAKEMIRGARHPGNPAAPGHEEGTSIQDTIDSDSDSADEFERQSTWSTGSTLVAPDDHSLDAGDGQKKPGLVGNIKNFRKHHTELNRKHRGLMQWKAARNAAWLGKSTEEMGSKLGGRIARPFVGHREREFAVDSEV